MKTNKYSSSAASVPPNEEKPSDNQENLPLSKSLSDNLNILYGLFYNCTDVAYREFTIDAFKCLGVLVYIKELADTKLINERIITSLMNIKEGFIEDLIPDKTIEIVKKYFLQVVDMGEISTIGEVTNEILNGNTVFLLDGVATALRMTTPGWKERNVAETQNEKVIRGSNEGLTENINTSIAQLRRKIKSSQLKLEEFVVGRQTKTKINIAYLQGIVDDNIVKEARERLGRIDVDSILESGYIEELIEDQPYTLFPQIQHSERPDVIAAALLEGRVAILVDGTPCVLIVPTIFIHFLQTSEDYYERYPISLFIRVIRLIFFVISLLFPGVYVAVFSYHKEMIPTPLLISLLQAAHGVPFPIFIEALIMELTFEALREAGIRLPAPANQTVGVVGALVIGDAVVKAGIISPFMVVVIAVTAIASFSIPYYDMGFTIRILRFFILFLGAFFGLYGIMLGILVLLINITSLRSFGVDYFSPIAPLSFKGLKDVLTRFPWWAMGERPTYTNGNNPHRQRSYLKPKPPTKGNKTGKGL